MKNAIPSAKNDISIENRAKLENLGFETSDHFHLRDQYGIEKVAGALALYEKSADRIKDPKAWILAALKDNL